MVAVTIIIAGIVVLELGIVTAQVLVSVIICNPPFIVGIISGIVVHRVFGIVGLGLVAEHHIFIVASNVV